MKFSIKSAGQYSNALTGLINEFSTFYGRDEYAGLVKVTEIHQKSKIQTGSLDIVLEDEEKEIKPAIGFFQIDPNTRIQILEDLIKEKDLIDSKINQEKSKLTLVSPITNETVTIDFAKKENAFFNRNLVNVYESLMNVESKETEKEGIFETTLNENKVALKYPILVKSESLIETKEITEKYIDLKEKLQLESDEIDKLQAGTTFEFDNKFSTFDTKESLVTKYSN